ncbi:MAG: response regulator [Gemmatimonadales bacterium]|nr:MAG: response regulator [Gemmatimonadales bacterium]
MVEPGSPPPPTVKEILYVDDSSFDRALVRDALEIESDAYRLTEAATDEELASILSESTNFDLVLSDFNILGMTGLDVLKRVREVMPDVPIIIVTGTGSEEIAVDALKAGADDYVIKQPSHIRRLPQTIEAVIEARRAKVERDRARALLEESEFRFRLLAEHSTDLILRIDPNCRILYTSPAARPMLGRDPQALDGRSFLDLVDAPYHRMVCETLPPCGASSGVVEEGSLTLPPMELVGEGRIRVWVETHGRVIPSTHTASGGVEVQLACRDVTERKRMEDTLRASREKLRQLRHLESVARLAGGVAHDFNNLLTVISGNTEMVRSGLDPEHPLRDEVEEISRAVRRAGELTRHLLEFSSGEMAPLRTVDIPELLEETESLLRRTIDDGVELQVEVSGDLPRVRSNPARLQQVVLNLGLNARDAIHSAGRRGTVRIAVDRWEPDSSGVLADPALREWLPGRGRTELVRIRVSDNGCGMDAGIVERVFEPFFTTKELGKGTGLGLASSFGTVRQAGGTILVDSVPDRGTTFTVLLPVPEESGTDSSATAGSTSRG